MAKKAAASGVKATSSPQATLSPAELEAKVCGLNIFKGGSDPETLPDSEYPDWVFELHKPRPTLNELLRKCETEGLDTLSTAEKRMLIKKWNKERIKERNAELAS
ncbi:hypothetical protein AB1Y20_012809 [Prymnesium parvum]